MWANPHQGTGKCHHGVKVSAAQVAQMINAVGAQRCTVGSDLGWAPVLPRPAQGYKNFLERLWDCGVAESDIETMAKTNPAHLLDLDVT